jgi:signal transduction histidine kinase
VARLHSRIYLHFLGVLLVAALAASVSFAIGTRGGFVREMGERTARHGAALAAERFGDRAALGDRFRQLGSDLDVDVTARDVDGRVVASTGRELPALGARQAAEVRAGGVVVANRPPWRAAAPIRDPQTGAVLGIVDIRPRHRFAGPRLLGPAVAVGALLLVVAAATRPLARRISRPVERLTEAARRLGEGDLSARVPDPPPGRPWWRWRRRARPDVDELRGLTRSFNDMAGRVERLVRDQKELLVNVSHELRSPLARIRVALALLPRGGGAETYLRDVERDLDDLDRLIDDVLTTARLEATGLPVHLAAVDPNELIAELAERARHDPLVAPREVRAAPGPPGTIIADGALLRRALWNLVENAAKYGAPPITLEAGRAGDLFTLTVTDEGPGIAPEERDRVAAPFYRIDRARTPAAPGAPPRGVGLGLTLARRVALVHGGTLTIGSARTEDAREVGCRVTIAIPPSPPAGAS